MKGLRIRDRKMGSGKTAENGDTAQYHYDCYFPRGDLLHSTRAIDPLESVVGSRDLCVGLAHGLEGMKVGGLRSVRVPPQLTHIEQKTWPDLPNNLTLRYEIELISINKYASS